MLVRKNAEEKILFFLKPFIKLARDYGVLLGPSYLIEAERLVYHLK